MTIHEKDQPAKFEWAGMVTFWQDGDGWVCRSPDERYVAWGRTKDEAEENLKQLLMSHQKENQ